MYVFMYTDYKKKLAQQISLNEKLHGELSGLKEDLQRLARESSSQSLLQVWYKHTVSVCYVCMNE